MRSLTRHAEAIKKIPRVLYKAGAQAYVRRSYPRHLFIETTATCQLSCNYCPRERTRKDMDFRMFQSIVREASSFGPTSFSLHLFGEPLLWPRLLDGINFIRRLNNKHVVLVTTNGILLNEYVSRLLQSGVDEIIWTWREEAKFKECTKRWLLNSTLHNKTRFRVRIIKEITPKEAWEEWKTWPSVEVRSLHNYGGNINTSGYQEEIGFVQNTLQTEQGSRWPCYHLWLAPAIAWNGEILLCCADPHRKESLGQFPDMSIAEAWQGGRLKKIRAAHMAGKFEGICKDCDVWRNYPDIFFKWQKKN